jgi:4-hydroxy-4-methyl-2-oxoglutarate aldolase
MNEVSISAPESLDHSELLELRRWNTPTIYNGWEQITRRDSGREAFNIEETIDFMPQMGAMVGRAVTVVCQPGNRQHPAKNPNAWSEYRRYVASVAGPKIVVVQDLDKPHVYGAFWGEVNANVHRALGCVGTITDGGIRDLDEMAYAGFKALGKRLCVGHAFSCPISWGEPVEVFGQRIEPNQLIHADKHGFLAVPAKDEAGLLEAARLMDSNECRTMISAARQTTGMSVDEMLESIDESVKIFGEHTRAKFNRRGEF